MSTAVAVRTTGPASGTPGKNGHDVSERKGTANGRAKAVQGRPKIFEEELAGLPGLINVKHREYVKAVRTSLQLAREAGDLLKEAKRLCKVLQISWKEWVKDNCDFSPRSVQIYMRIAANWKELEKAQCIALLGVAGADRLLAAMKKRPRKTKAGAKKTGSHPANASGNRRDRPSGDDPEGHEICSGKPGASGSSAEGEEQQPHDSTTATVRTAATVLEACANAHNLEWEEQVLVLARFLEDDAIEVMAESVTAQDRTQEFEEYVKDNWMLGKVGRGQCAPMTVVAG